MFSFGDILVINFPFSDGKNSKRRPVMVIKETGDGDLLIAKITSKLYNTDFDVSISQWQEAGLISASVARIHKIQTLHSSLVVGHIGKLAHMDLKAARHTLANLVLSL
jgi:mRNA interferase MazF